MKVHPTAIVDPAARLCEGVQIGPFSIVGASVSLGPGTHVGSHCSLGVEGPRDQELILGADARIRSHSVLYLGVSAGDGLETGHGVTVREGTSIGMGFRMGTLSDIEGHCNIGDHVRLHSNVHIGQLSQIGNFVWIFPYVVLTNDPHPPSDGHMVGVVVEDYAAIATMSVVLPGIRVGKDSLVGAYSLVTRDVRAGSVVVGVPAKDKGDASAIPLSDGSGQAYPWRYHFHRGYPDDVVTSWIAESNLRGDVGDLEAPSRNPDPPQPGSMA